MLNSVQMVFSTIAVCPLPDGCPYKATDQSLAPASMTPTVRVVPQGSPGAPALPWELHHPYLAVLLPGTLTLAMIAMLAALFYFLLYLRLLREPQLADPQAAVPGQALLATTATTEAVQAGNQAPVVQFQGHKLSQELAPLVYPKQYGRYATAGKVLRQDEIFLASFPLEPAKRLFFSRRFQAPWSRLLLHRNITKVGKEWRATGTLDDAVTLAARVFMQSIVDWPRFEDALMLPTSRINRDIVKGIEQRTRRSLTRLQQKDGPRLLLCSEILVCATVLLTVEQEYPEDRAATLFHLGYGYVWLASTVQPGELILGWALRSYQAALLLYEQEQMFYYAAMTLVALGDLYHVRSKLPEAISQREDVGKAVQCYRRARTYTPHLQPELSQRLHYIEHSA